MGEHVEDDSQLDAVPLASQDQAILRLESSTIVGHTCKIILLGGQAPDLAALRSLIAGRVGSTPALTRRLAHTPGGLAWVPDGEFDITSHVVPAPGDKPVDRAALARQVARLFAERLDRQRPLWRIDVLPREGEGAALIWRVHHSLADGATAMRYARMLLWDPSSRVARTERSHTVSQARDEARRRGHLAGFLCRELALNRECSPFDGRIGTRREVAFASAPLSPLHRVTKAQGGPTLNDAVLAIVVGGLRRWLVLRHGHLGALRVRVPVSLHQPGEGAANRDSFFTVGLPLNEPDPLARLRATCAATAVPKAEHDAQTMEALTRHLARISPSLERWFFRLGQNPRSFAVNVSNVPGPRIPVAVLGAPVEALYTLAEIGERHALRVAVISLADTLFFGLCADPALVDNVQIIAEAIETEAEALAACP